MARKKNDDISYLLSLQDSFKKELQSRFDFAEINSWVEFSANLHDKADKLQGGENAKLKKIYFQLPNHTAIVRICVLDGDKLENDLELANDDDEDDSYYHSREKFHTEDIFSVEMITTMGKWLEEAAINNFISRKFRHYKEKPV